MGEKKDALAPGRPEGSSLDAVHYWIVLTLAETFSSVTNFLKTASAMGDRQISPSPDKLLMILDMFTSSSRSPKKGSEGMKRLHLKRSSFRCAPVVGSGNNSRLTFNEGEPKTSGINIAGASLESHSRDMKHPEQLAATSTDERAQLSVGHNHSMMELQGSDGK
ncbi:hypothetical protein U0070_024204 [Myodes glareolus]|uniref:Uncharacterized protein n=1 Tax=Myodes glareolus TaxID=447135 RepID=A0AAW0I9I1_MYOGA